MIIPCEACQSTFQLDQSLVKPTGSKVRCSKCQDIFTIYPSKHNELSCYKNKTLDGDEGAAVTNVKHSHLDDQFQGVSRAPEMTISAGENKKSDNSSVESIEPKDDFEEAVEDENIKYSGLPGISEIEAMVDSIWDGRDHIKDISPYFLDKYSLTQDLNISCG